MRTVALFCFLLLAALPLSAAEVITEDSRSGTNWAIFVEPDFPFFSSVLDARDLGPEWPTNNLTPRGIVLNLGNHCWACFDTELLRISAIWEGAGVTPVSLSQISYQKPGRKAAEGQEKLPRIAGKPWLATGLYPGWQAGEQPGLSDPRAPGSDPKEIGRGPLTETEGRFKAIQLLNRGVCLEYRMEGTTVREIIESSTGTGTEVRRFFHLDRVNKPLWLLMGRTAPGVRLILGTNAAPGVSLNNNEPEQCITVRVEPSTAAVEFAVAVGKNPSSSIKPRATDSHTDVRWPESIITHASAAAPTNSFVVDDIALPLSNPWRRNVRLADIAFFPNGRGAVVTFDGDVWLADDLAARSGEVSWRRFASGFHEPLSLCVRSNALFVFDRNGIWKITDADANGEAERQELFCNAFAQTAETREFANGMKAAPDGSFIIAKGGQQGSTLGKHNGTVLRVAPDGKTFSVLGWGLRQPFIGVNPETGLVTASDQQGNYVPATPIQLIRDHQYYGFLAAFQPREKYPEPIAEPLVWIPHPVNASGASQVWLTGAKMGPLNNALVHVGYSRSELFQVLFNSRAPRLQAAVVSLTQDLPFAPLNGAVNPIDGQLYLAGFQIWGSTAPRVSGLARFRYTGMADTLPREIAAMDKGILLRFGVPLDKKKAIDPANFSVERWNYKRTANYGSPHYKLDGTPGQEWLTPSSAYLSRDAKSVFIGIPDMKPVMQMRIGWALATEAGVSFEQNAYLTAYVLTSFEPKKEGFKSLKVDLTPRPGRKLSTPVTIEEGQRLARLMGCMACHSTDGTTAGRVGPTWKGLFGSQVEIKDGEPAIADEAYLRESMLEPNAKVVQGFDKSDAGMPSYAGVLTDAQIEALVLYIKTLK